MVKTLGGKLALKFGSAGTLYFMKERDRFDKSTSPFVKIGIVKGDADVKRRESEHQTGNPREIYSHKEIASPAVQMLETFMHNFFAPQRIRGEWFRDEQLDQMIAEAEKRTAELISAEPYHSLVSELDGAASAADFNPSNEAVTDADVSMRWMLDASLKNYRRQRKALSDRMVELWSDEDDNYFQKTNRNSKSEFQVGLAKKLFPDLSKHFVEATEIWKREWLSPAKGERAVAVDSPKTSNLLNSSSLVELHGAYLDIWSKSAVVEWELVNLEARLQAELGTHEVLTHGGAVVLQWQKKVSTSFNKAAFVEAHPQEAAECMKSNPGGVSYLAAEWKSYG